MKHEIGTNFGGPDVWVRVFLPADTPTSVCARLDEALTLSATLRALDNFQLVRDVRDTLKGLAGLGPVTLTAVVSVPIGTRREKVWKAKTEAEVDNLDAELALLLRLFTSPSSAPKSRPFADGVMPCSRTGMVAALMACGIPAKGWEAILLDDHTGVAEVVFNENQEHNAQPLITALYKAKAAHELHYKRGDHLLTVVVNCRECEEVANG
jgi:hypothetical protein